MIVTVGNEKGGVGKTTLVMHLAFAASEAGKRTLVIDFDTQGNASQMLSTDPLRIASTPNGAETLLRKGPPAIRKSSVPGVDLLHGHRGLEAIDAHNMGEASALRERILALPYDVVIVDTPPSFGARHVAPLFWADRIVVPLEPTMSSLAGLDAVQTTMRQVRKVRTGVKTFYVLNRLVKSSGTQRGMGAQLKKILGKELLEPLSLRVAVSDALAIGKPVWAVARDRALRKQWKDLVSTILGLGAEA